MENPMYCIVETNIMERWSTRDYSKYKDAADALDKLRIEHGSDYEFTLVRINADGSFTPVL